LQYQKLPPGNPDAFRKSDLKAVPLNPGRKPTGMFIESDIGSAIFLPQPKGSTILSDQLYQA